MIPQAWFAAIAVDLLVTLSNPFACYRSLLRKYHAAIWSLGLAFSGAMTLWGGCQGKTAPSHSSTFSLAVFGVLRPTVVTRRGRETANP